MSDYNDKIDTAASLYKAVMVDVIRTPLTAI
jgi:hypothetical protein